ncbi:MAG: TatD family hydrolase [Burkholderiales bacterium]|nr:TatD family hydrolase [Burkholderiales bacterium]
MGPLVDTHNHFFIQMEPGAAGTLLNAALEAGLEQMLMCAGDFETGLIAEKYAKIINSGYAIGIHPLYVPEKAIEQVGKIKEFLEENRNSPYLCAVGEIGLDGSKESTCPMDVQEKIFKMQLGMARDFELPITVHARGALDLVCKWLKRFEVPGGCVHAFNGSAEQAKRVTDMGFKIGFGGAATYSGSKRIRKLLAEAKSKDYVLETDCPDMPSSARREENPINPHSYPVDIAAYATEAASLRNETVEEVCRSSTYNAYTAFPKLKDLGSLKWQIE